MARQVADGRRRCATQMAHSRAAPMGPFSCIETRRPPAPESDGAPGATGTPGVTACVVCCGPTTRRFALCFACRTVAFRLGVPLAPVMPAHLCPVPGALYTVLMGYKEAPVHEARRRFAGRVCRLFADFFVTHRACLARCDRGRHRSRRAGFVALPPGWASLEACDGLGAPSVSSVGPGATWAPRVLQRPAEGGIGIGHMRPAARAFAVPGPWRASARGARVLLLDDTYVSGRGRRALRRRSGCGAPVPC